MNCPFPKHERRGARDHTYGLDCGLLISKRRLGMDFTFIYGIAHCDIAKNCCELACH